MMCGQQSINSVLTVLFATICGIHGTSNNTTHAGLSTRTAFACEGNMVTITCKEGLSIQVIESYYGRRACNEGNGTEESSTNCTAIRTLEIVSKLCNNKSVECKVPTSTIPHLDKTCHGSTKKFLEVTYTCIEGRSTSPPVTQRFTRPQKPSSSPPLEPTEETRNYFHLASSTSVYNDSFGDGRPEEWCEEKMARNILWPKTWSGQTALMHCPNNQAVEKASWKCGKNSTGWIDYPDLSQCISSTVAGMLDLVHEIEERFSDGAVKLIASDLTSCTDAQESLFGGDLLGILTAMKKVTNQIDNRLRESSPEVSSDLVMQVNQAVITASDNLLTESRIESWYDVPKSMRADVATEFLSTIEKSSYQVASITTTAAKFLNIKSNLVVEVRVVNITEPVDDQVFPQGDTDLPSFAVSSNGSFIELKSKTVLNFGVSGLSKMVFATFNNIESFLQMDDSLQEFETSDISEFRKLDLANDTSYNSYQEGSIGSKPPVSNSQNKSDNLRNKTVNTRIISASFVTQDMKTVFLEEPVIFTMKHFQEENASDPSCVFWDYSKTSMKGRWSTHGCTLDYTNATHTRCSCSHLTNFAILMSIKEQQLTALQAFTLSFITYLGCILSIICLALAFLTFQFFKNLRCDRNTIHKNLVINLCVAEIVFLVGIVPYKNQETLCSIVAGVLHYIFLVSFVWICLEGIQLYMMLVEVFEAKSSRIKWFYLSAYGIPALIVIISSAVNPNGYGTKSHCWLSTEKDFVWAFMGPVCFIVCINLVMLSVAMYVMCTHSSNVNACKARQKTTFENIRSWVKGAIVLVFLLGLTWIFGFFYIDQQSLFMAYLFTAFNSLQGVFIFLFHCLLNEKVQKEYKRWVRHTKWLPQDLRVRCGGVRSSGSVSPMHTSSSGKTAPEQKKSFEYITRIFSRSADHKRSSTLTLPSSSSSNAKRDYNLIYHHSDSRTGSGENESSQMYSEMTEDPFSYMESAQLTYGPKEDFYLPTGDISMIEGSVVDTDYLDNFPERTSSKGVRKCMIRNKMLASHKEPGMIPTKHGS